MDRFGINRRHLIASLIAGLGAGACSSVPMPKLADGPPRVPVKTAIRLGPAPIKGPDARFAFTQISGAPAVQVMNFSRALDSEAEIRKLNIVPEGDPSATYLVKGYLSAIGDKRGTLLVYVWDVTDPSGKRLHRVSGQQESGGSPSDPWAGITEDAVLTAAKRTIDDLAAWSN